LISWLDFCLSRDADYSAPAEGTEAAAAFFGEPRREGRDMPARKLIEGASLGPEALNPLFQAFDEAWVVLAPRYGCDAPAIKAARTRLASILLGLAREDSRDAAALKKAALQRYDAATGGR
jgi:hypothetical protein